MITYRGPNCKQDCELFTLTHSNGSFILVDEETFFTFLCTDRPRVDIFIDAVIQEHKLIKLMKTPAPWKVEPSLIPPYALTQIAEVLTKGKQKYPDEKWKVLSIKDHVDATLRHLLAYLRGEWNEEEQCNHLVNAACRLLFAIEKLPKDRSE